MKSLTEGGNIKAYLYLTDHLSQRESKCLILAQYLFLPLILSSRGLRGPFYLGKTGSSPMSSIYLLSCKTSARKNCM